jgi:hypothetical protein
VILSFSYVYERAGLSVCVFRLLCSFWYTHGSCRLMSAMETGPGPQTGPPPSWSGPGLPGPERAGLVPKNTTEGDRGLLEKKNSKS